MSPIRAVIAALRAPPPVGRCVRCGYFQDEAAVIEASIPGMTAMGSAHASARGNDGICLLQDVYLSGLSGCDRFVAR